MPTKKIVAEHKNSMEKAVEFLQQEFRGIRTGRASTGLVDHLMVEYYGTPTPLKQLAAIAAPEAALIVIKPFDAACIKDVEKAIRNSDLSIAPIVDGKVIRLNVPPLSQERRSQLVNQVRQLGEKAKISVRNIRRDANKHLDDEEKSKTISEDERDKAKKDIDNLTKEFIDKVDSIIKTKTEEIMKD